MERRQKKPGGRLDIGHNQQQNQRQQQHQMSSQNPRHHPQQQQQLYYQPTFQPHNYQQLQQQLPHQSVHESRSYQQPPQQEEYHQQPYLYPQQYQLQHQQSHFPSRRYEQPNQQQQYHHQHYLQPQDYQPQQQQPQSYQQPYQHQHYLQPQDSQPQQQQPQSYQQSYQHQHSQTQDYQSQQQQYNSQSYQQSQQRYHSQPNLQSRSCESHQHQSFFQAQPQAFTLLPIGNYRIVPLENTQQQCQNIHSSHLAEVPAQLGQMVAMDGRPSEDVQQPETVTCIPIVKTCSQPPAPHQRIEQPGPSRPQQPRHESVNAAPSFHKTCQRPDHFHYCCCLQTRFREQLNITSLPGKPTRMTPLLLHDDSVVHCKLPYSAYHTEPLQEHQHEPQNEVEQYIPPIQQPHYHGSPEPCEGSHHQEVLSQHKVQTWLFSQQPECEEQHSQHIICSSKSRSSNIKFNCNAPEFKPRESPSTSSGDATQQQKTEIGGALLKCNPPPSTSLSGDVTQQKNEVVEAVLESSQTVGSSTEAPEVVSKNHIEEVNTGELLLEEPVSQNPPPPSEDSQHAVTKNAKNTIEGSKRTQPRDAPKENNQTEGILRESVSSEGKLSTELVEQNQKPVTETLTGKKQIVVNLTLEAPTSSVTGNSSPPSPRNIRDQGYKENDITVLCPLGKLPENPCTWKGKLSERMNHLSTVHNTLLVFKDRVEITQNEARIFIIHGTIFVAFTTIHPMTRKLYCVVHHACIKRSCSVNFQYICELRAICRYEMIRDIRLVVPFTVDFPNLMSTGRCVRYDSEVVRRFGNKVSVLFIISHPSEI